METTKQVVENLNVTAQMLTALSMQYRVYKVNMKVFGLCWVAKKIDKKYHHAEKQLDCVIKRIFYYGEDPEYDIGTVAGADSVTEIFTHCLKMVSAILEHAIECRKESFEARPDYTTDVYEHLIKEMEYQEMFFSQQMKLMKTVGGEPNYIASRLDDGK